MILRKFRFKNTDWELKDVDFGPLNLIVGRNAVGKSKTLVSLAGTLQFMRNDFPSNNIAHMECELILESAQTYIYSFSVTNNIIEKEYLATSNGTKIIDRQNGKSLLRGEIINPPVNTLILQSRRDTENYPEFEEILNWADHVTGFMFSSVSSFHYGEDNNFLFKGSYDFSELFDKLDDEQVKHLITTLKELEYNVTDMKNISIDAGREYKLTRIKEAGVNANLFSFSLSNGMYRVIYLLVYMYYISSVKGARCILIDDLGEGLDFDRSSKLSRILFSYCKKNNIQLIVTSNDDFLLNSIPLKYWIILSRKGSVVSSISNSTDPDLFKKFKFTGLNNFDLISSDFIDRFFQKEKH